MLSNELEIIRKINDEKEGKNAQMRAAKRADG